MKRKNLRNSFDQCKDDIYSYIVENAKKGRLASLRKEEIFQEFLHSYNRDTLENAIQNLEDNGSIKSNETYVKFYIPKDHSSGKYLMSELRKRKMLFSTTKALLFGFFLASIIWILYNSLTNLIYFQIGTLTQFQNGLFYGIISMLITSLVSIKLVHKLYPLYYKIIEVKSELQRTLIIGFSVAIIFLATYFLTNKDPSTIGIVTVIATVLITYFTRSKRNK